MVIAILGCGPAGLAAALAVASSGRHAVIFSSTNAPSTIYGCQYLHAPVPGYESVPHTRAGYYLNGTPEQYRAKVYGENWKGKVAPEDFPGEHEAWDIRATYRAMWDDLHRNPLVRFVRIPPVTGGNIDHNIYRFHPEHIISTIPARAMCYNKEHEFSYHYIWATGSRSKGNDPEDTIICDGTGEHTWYRNACMFGYRTTEWAIPPVNGEGKVRVIKPLSTTCNCHPSIYRIGRYGKWFKNYLVCNVYPDVTEILRND